MAAVCSSQITMAEHSVGRKGSETSVRISDGITELPQEMRVEESPTMMRAQLTMTSS